MPRTGALPSWHGLYSRMCCAWNTIIRLHVHDIIIMYRRLKSADVAGDVMCDRRMELPPLILERANLGRHFNLSLFEVGMLCEAVEGVGSIWYAWDCHISIAMYTQHISPGPICSTEMAEYNLLQEICWVLFYSYTYWEYITPHAQCIRWFIYTVVFFRWNTLRTMHAWKCVRSIYISHRSDPYFHIHWTILSLCVCECVFCTWRGLNINGFTFDRDSVRHDAPTISDLYNL